MTVRCASVLVSLLFVVGIPSRTHAQEVQVPLNADSTLYAVDAELEDRLNLFPDVRGFQEAVLYRQSKGTYELVVQYREGSQTVRDRRTLTASEVKDLRRRVTRRLRATGTKVGLNQEGRADLLTTTTLLGIAEGGLLAGAVANEDDESLIATLPLLGGGLGFFVPLMASRNATVTEAAAALTWYGGLQGYGHAVQLVGLVSGNDADGHLTSGLAAAIGATEAAIGYRIGSRRGWSGGTAEMIAYNGAIGNLVGLGTFVLVAGSDDDVEGAFDSQTRVRLGMGTSLVGSLGGMIVGHQLAQSERYTEGDARIYVNAGLLGAQLGGSVLSATESPSESPRWAAGTLTASTLGGLAAGTLLLRDRDFDKSEGNIVALGTYAGGLLGSALSAASNAEEETTFILSTLGSAVGFGVGFSLFARGAERRVATATSRVNLRVLPSLQAPRSIDLDTSSWTPQWRPGLTIQASF